MIAPEREWKNPPHHGGQLHDAAKTYGIPVHQWLDLSTGINPFSWTPPHVPQSVWQRLPDSYHGLEAAAKHYYGRACVATPGTQWLIQELPRHLTAERVWIPEIGYEEYHYQWRKQKHTVKLYQNLPQHSELRPKDVVVVINPNNPSAHSVEATDLLDLATALSQQKGSLIVDEAFMDLTPERSLLQHDLPQNIIVLRSVGKFFGLAGIRLGFAHCTGSLLQFVDAALGPWAISHPAVYLGEHFLMDRLWQQQNRKRILDACAQLHTTLSKHFRNPEIHQGGLFCSVNCGSQRAEAVFQHCARNGILTRQFKRWGIVRFGLADEIGVQRLDQALKQIVL